MSRVSSSVTDSRKPGRKFVPEDISWGRYWFMSLVNFTYVFMCVASDCLLFHVNFPLIAFSSQRRGKLPSHFWLRVFPARRVECGGKSFLELRIFCWSTRESVCLMKSRILFRVKVKKWEAWWVSENGSSKNEKEQIFFFFFFLHVKEWQGKCFVFRST